jgi:hypothetical protein
MVQCFLPFFSVPLFKKQMLEGLNLPFSTIFLDFLEPPQKANGFYGVFGSDSFTPPLQFLCPRFQPSGRAQALAIPDSGSSAFHWQLQFAPYSGMQ